MPEASFTSSAFSVPYSTAEYTNSDGNGAGFMGPYAPQLDYAAVGNFDNGRQLNCGHPTDTEIVCPALLPPPPALQSGDLPASGGFPAGFPGNNNANANQQSWFPQQYWPNENRGTINPPNLNCSPGSSTFQPTIDFVATQFQTQVRQQGEPAHSYPYCQNQDTTGSPNLCVQVFASSAEFVGEFAGIQRDDRLRNRWSFLQVESKERCWSSSDSIA
ncbi:MAG: hypothetical protein ABR880_24610 [Candidatus Sulfotelmatobacter sp.]